VKNVIRVNLNKREDYINKFSSDRISRELNKYLLDEIKTIGLKEKIKIEITSKFEMTDEEKQKLIEMIKYNYKDDITDISIISKRILVLDAIIFVLGVFCLGLYSLSESVKVMSEIILIIGWLLIWEATYNTIFSKMQDRHKVIRRNQLVKSQIIFK